MRAFTRLLKPVVRAGPVTQNFTFIHHHPCAAAQRRTFIRHHKMASTEPPHSPNQDTAPSTTNQTQNKKRPHKQGGNHTMKKRKSKREKNIKEGSSIDVLALDIEALRISPTTKDGQEIVFSQSTSQDCAPLPEEGSEIDVQVVDLASTGEGLAFQHNSPSRQVYVVPFVTPGDVARVKIYRHSNTHSVADFLSVTTPGPLRDDSRIRCKYFAACSGCQFQMMDYPSQLAHKKRIVQKAFRNFSIVAPELIPPVGDTIGSPLQYGYRTKLTPHFDAPPGTPRRKSAGAIAMPFEKCPDIGFMQKGKQKVLDIEECPIGTEALGMGMTRERERMKQAYGNYTRGSTLLLRETTTRYPKDSDAVPRTTLQDAVRVDGDEQVDIKTWITDNKALTTEYVGTHIFTNPAGAFFQNNNSILPIFTQYIRDHILPPASSSHPKIKHLIDAYSGSGLFTITLSSAFTSSTGIDISESSIASARENATLNGLAPDRCNFIAADAKKLFEQVEYDPNETVVVLDPPRKGCDENFLGQLLRFGPRRVAYVSCNVHTQARDVGILVRGMEAEDGEKKGSKTRYDVESLVGFDFFPQTAHVEGVCVLTRHEEEITSSEGAPK